MTPIEEALIRYDGVDDLVYKALKETQKRDNPKALTLDELKITHGEPIYLQRISYAWGEWHICWGERHYMKRGKKVINLGYSWNEPEETYGKTWLAYRYKPKECAE